MNEKNMGMEHGDPSIEELDEDGLTKEQREYAYGKLTEFENPNLPQEERRDFSNEIHELESMFKAFQEEHSLEELTKITEYTSNEQLRAHPLREPARQALIPITEKFNAIKFQSTISDEDHAKLKTEYRKLFLALGITRGTEIIHKD